MIEKFDCERVLTVAQQDDEDAKLSELKNVQKVENLALSGDLLNLIHGDESLSSWNPSAESTQNQEEIIKQIIEI